MERAAGGAPRGCLPGVSDGGSGAGAVKGQRVRAPHAVLRGQLPSQVESLGLGAAADPLVSDDEEEVYACEGGELER